MSYPQNKKPGSVGKRKPGQQHNIGRSIAGPNYSKRIRLAKPRFIPPRISPADFYSNEIDGYSESENGWAHGCCPFHDDHNPSFAMNLESGGFKCLSSNCGVSGGSIVSFVCQLRGVSAQEAFRFLEAQS